MNYLCYNEGVLCLTLVCCFVRLLGKNMFGINGNDTTWSKLFCIPVDQSVEYCISSKDVVGLI